MRAMLAQVLRRALQLAVVAFIAYAALGGAWRNYKLAHNHRRIVSLIEGEPWGYLYGLNEDALSLAGESYETSLSVLGFPWAARVFGFDTADPMLVASIAAQAERVPWSLLAAVAIPLLLALLMGKVFCSHLCPMRLLFEIGELVRRGLKRLGVPLLELRHRARFGGWVLLGGLLASVIASTAVWLLVLPYAGLSAAIFLLVTAGTTAGLFTLVALWLAVDVFVAPGYFCHNLCPTGFLLEQLGRVSPFALRKRGTEPCPQGCHTCQSTCPYGLSARDETHRPACDSCGRCVVACPSNRLVRRVSLPVLAAALLACLALPQAAHAHHNKGLPHYGYFENYPQVPTEEYVAVHGRWEIGATMFNFQGLDRRTADTPNDVKLYLYLYDLEAGAAYAGPLAVEIRDGDDVVARFDRVAVDEEAVYSTRETLPASGDYDLVAFVGGEEVVLPFSVELANEGVSWWTIGGITLPVLVIFGLAFHGRRRRRTRKRVPASVAVAVLLLLVSPMVVSSSQAQTQVAAVTPTAVDAEICPVCGMRNCTMDHSGASGAGQAHHHYTTPEGASVMVMGGIPPWLFMLGIVLVIALSFVAVEWGGAASRRARTAARPFRLNLVKKKRAYAWLRSRWFQAMPQLLMGAVLVFLIWVGLFGSRVANLTPVAVWTVWWAGLIFAVLLLGSAWCFVCPWDGLANLASRLRLAAKVDTLSLRLPYPKALANMYPAVALFALLTWLELGWGVTTDPRLTAYLGLGMAAAAIAGALLWDGKRFCAHLCPVGRICGIYSNFSPVEIRARNPRTCQVCTTEDCLHGNDRGYPCPTGISLKTTDRATMCTACTECIKSCDKHNVAINVRPFAADLSSGPEPKTDEAWLAIVLLALTLFHGLSMTSLWESFEPGAWSIVKWVSLTLGTPKTVSFTLAMVVAVAIPIGVYWSCCRVAAWWAADGVSSKRLFVAYAFSVLPVALFYHLAHNLMHLLMEGGGVVPMLSDPLGTGANWLGTAGMHIGSLISDQSLWYAQVGLIVIGHVYGIVIAHRIGHRVHRDAKAARRSLVPIPVAMVLISVCGLWLMHLDMNMRMGRM